MFKWVLNLLEKMGRKYVMISELGETLMERWYLFGSRNSRWPHLVLHHIPSLPRVQKNHTHPTNVYSLILKGGYVELVNESLVRVRRRWSFGTLKHTDRHSITSVDPNTWTLFLCGFFKAEWKLQIEGENEMRKYKGVWTKVTPDLEKKIARRKAAVLKKRTITVTTVKGESHNV